MAGQVSSACHCVRLRRTSGKLTDFYSRMLEPSGLTLPQFSLLKNIDHLGECSTAQLSRKVGLEHSTLVRNLRLLVTQGLVVDRKKPGCKCNMWHITESGNRALAKGIPLWEKAQRTVEDALGLDGLRQFEDMLDRIYATGGKDMRKKLHAEKQA